MNERGRNTFSKSERLCSKKLIDEIFERGNTFCLSLFRVSWILLPPDLSPPAQVALSVPKKSIRSAVARNLIRRRMREAYRKNKYILYDFLNAGNFRLAFVLIFRGSTIIDYHKIEESVIETLEALNKNVKQKQPNLVKEK
jgi:ribonuclease P protein component